MKLSNTRGNRSRWKMLHGCTIVNGTCQLTSRLHSGISRMRSQTCSSLACSGVFCIANPSYQQRGDQSATRRPISNEEINQQRGDQSTTRRPISNEETNQQRGNQSAARRPISSEETNQQRGDQSAARWFCGWLGRRSMVVPAIHKSAA